MVEGICYSMGSRNRKTIKGHVYLYYVSTIDGIKKAHYCGRESKPESEKKAIDFEIQELRYRRDEITKKISELRTKSK